MMMTDDAIREVHGIHARQVGYSDVQIITIRERENEIILDRRASDISLTPWQARYLAAKLYRLSRRVRNRTEDATC